MNLKYISYFFIVICVCSGMKVSARDFYNDIIKNNLFTNKYAVDTEASAVVLYEYTSEVITQDDPWFDKKKICHKIIKILKKDAFDLANVQVLFPYNNYRNYVTNVKGITYNTSGNDTVTSSINNKDLYTKRLQTDIYEMTFSLPAVKEGSIIEYSYEIDQVYSTDIFTWEIQDEYPKLFCEYNVDYPTNMQFTTLMHVRGTAQDYSSRSDAEDANDAFSRVTSKKYSNDLYWIRRNVPGLKKEPYVIDRPLYLERLELQLTGITIPKYGFTGITSWEKLNNKFWKDFGWGKKLTMRNTFFDNVIDTLIKPGNTPEANARLIFNYVRAHFKCNNDNFEPNQIRTSEIFNDNEGNEAEINFLLTTMLTHIGLNAAPILLSTTGNMPMSSAFPMLDRIRYLACALKIDSNYIFLDASDKNNVFGRLPVNCYNGFSWILGEEGTGILLGPDRLKDKTICNVKISNISDSAATVEITEKYGLIQSELLRKEWAKDEDEKKKFVAKRQKYFPTNYKIQSHFLENAEDPDTNIITKYTCKATIESGSFFITTLMRTFTENPFKATVRHFPIEYPFRSENYYVINAVLPANMEADSIPKPVVIKLGDDDMTYTNSVMTYGGHSILLTSDFSINTTSYSADNYDAIRHFIETIIDEENRIILIKRK